VARPGIQQRHLPAAYHARFLRDLAESRLRLWRAELESGRRRETPALTRALAEDERLIARLTAELAEDAATPGGLDLAAGGRPLS
jgi:hypothetical protein